ncbi:amidohydrolase [Microvirga sp. TS319]|uniref:amidohydrolase n=1 Tax=Microvirga sp. TS319 TaxID=3241165 RepID=UPI00351AADA8
MSTPANGSSFLSRTDLTEIIEWRRQLHRMPELSGEEERTAREVCAFLAQTEPDGVMTGLGGHGVAMIYRGLEPGPTILFRSELDALPIDEVSEVPHRSTVPGKAHLCGHDGHMAILAALARGLGRQRPLRGRVVLMFQPAEENGSGAAAVVRDSRYREIAPDLAFSCHNMPGIPLGQVALAEGPVNCASRGMRIRLLGKTAHASQPETGNSPMAAVASLMPALTALGKGERMDRSFTMVTVTHAKMGEPAFGIAPGCAEIWITLRTLTDDRMAGLCAQAENLAYRIADKMNLRVELDYDDVFDMVENASAAVAHLRRALDAEGIPHDSGHLPLRGSEDFGRFGQSAPAAMFFLGAGENHPRLHNPDYDFPDGLIEIGSRVFMRTVRHLLG